MALCEDMCALIIHTQQAVTVHSIRDLTFGSFKT